MKKCILMLLMFNSFVLFCQTLPNGQPSYYYDGQENQTTNTNKPNNQFAKINFFDWTQEIYPSNIMNTQNPLKNPFTNFEIGGTIRDLVANATQSVPYFPEDGWELINEKLGWKWDANGGQAGAQVCEPCIILYNRYTGLLRVLFSFSRNTKSSEDLKYMTVSIVQKKSGAQDGVPNSLLTYKNSNVLLPLSNSELFNGDKIINTSYAKYSRFTLDPYDWYYADFQTNYDPCTCYLKTLYKIEVNVVSITEKIIDGQKVKITGNNPFDITFFINPYSKDMDNWNQYWYPYYNNPYGVFNLLNTMNLMYDEGDESTSNAYHDILIKLDNNFKYVINQAAGFKNLQDRNNIKIFASIQAKITKSSEALQLFFTENDSADFYSSKYYPIECLLNKTIKISEYKDVDVWYQKNDTYNWNHFPHFQLDSMYIKLFVKLNNMDNNEIQFWGRFPLNTISDWNLATNDSITEKFKNSKNLDTICYISPFTKERNDIIIDTNLALSCTHIPPVTDAQEIYDFCHQNGVNTYNFNARDGKEGTGSFQEEPKVKEDMIISIYPNPISDYFNISFYTPERIPMIFKLFDVFGREIKSINICSMQGSNSLRYNCTELMIGSYYLNISTESGYTHTYPILILR